MDSEMTTQAEAVAALEYWQDHENVAELIGVPPPDSQGPFFARSVGVSADPPDFQDHFVLVSVPATTELSRFPLEVRGVRVVVDHLDRPGAVGYAPHPRHGPRI